MMAVCARVADTIPDEGYRMPTDSFLSHSSNFDLTLCSSDHLLPPPPLPKMPEALS